MEQQTAHPAIYEQIVSSLTSGVIAVDADGHVLVANEAAARHLDVAPTHLMPGAALDDIPGAAEPLRRLLDELGRHHAVVSRREATLSAPEGNKVLGISASPLQGPASFNGAIFLFMDITELRRLERTAELNRQLAQIGELTAGVVHELRNPLSVISGMAELLLRKSVDQDPVHAKASTILAEAGQMEQLVSQFLSFAKPFELKPCACTVADILERSRVLCAPLAEQCAIALQVDAPDETPALLADVSKMAQALSNILRNAIEVSSPGGRVRFHARCLTDQVVFRVDDQGPGIHLEDGEDLFSAFFTKKAGGTGLGLSIVHRIVTAHRGTITYGNNEPTGAWFEVAIPQDLTRTST